MARSLLLLLAVLLAASAAGGQEVADPPVVALPPLLPLPEPEFFIVLNFLATYNYSILASILNEEPIRSVVLQYLLDDGKLTIFAPADDVLASIAKKQSKGKYGRYCKSRVNGAVNNATLVSTVGLHIVRGYFTNDDLISLDFLTALTSFTPVPLYALPSWASSPVGSIQVGTSNGANGNVLSWVNILEHGIYNSSSVIIHRVEGAVTYPVLSPLV